MESFENFAKEAKKAREKVKTINGLIKANVPQDHTKDLSSWAKVKIDYR